MFLLAYYQVRVLICGFNALAFGRRECIDRLEAFVHDVFDVLPDELAGAFVQGQDFVTNLNVLHRDVFPASQDLPLRS